MPARAVLPQGPFTGDPTQTVYTKEGLLAVVQGLRPARPERLDRQALQALGETERAVYDDRRTDWHANLGPYKVRALTRLNDDLFAAFDKNRQQADKLRPGFAVIGNAGVAKSTSLAQLAARVHRQRVATKGPLTETGHQRLPVCLITLGGDTSMLELNTAALDFYGCPYPERSSAAVRLRLWAHCIDLCGTELVLIDDFHFLQPATKNGAAVSNHIKKTATDLRVTMGFGAVEIHGGLLTEGRGTSDEARLLAQTGRRCSVYRLEPLPKPNPGDHTRTCDGGCPKCQWHALVKSFESDVVLADGRPGMLTELEKPLWDMSQGYLLTLADIVLQLAYEAVHSGTETITREDLRKVRLDSSADTAYRTGKGEVADRRGRRDVA